MLRRSLRAVVLLGVGVLATQTFVAIGWLRPVVVTGDSMSPALLDGKRVWVSRWRRAQRWDVIVLRSPEDARSLIVKRVIGLPGEAVRFRGGDVWVNGAPALPRNPDVERSVYFGAFGDPSWRLGDGEWLVVGDSQPTSIDSRNWAHAAGVPERLMIGVTQ